MSTLSGMKRTGTVLMAAAGLLLGLTGCAPNHDAALKECKYATANAYFDKYPEPDLDKHVEILDEIRKQCDADLKKDPDKFEQTWGKG